MLEKRDAAEDDDERPLLTVIICTYNPRDAYFGRCLEALRAQTLPERQWEMVIVDNRSEPAIASRFSFDWQTVRLVREEKLGLTPARLRGISEARGELLVFVDDDNLLEPDYLERALQISRTHPFLGSWSGQCLPEFEIPPAEWTRRYWGNLCIRTFDEMFWSNLPRLPETMPAGAGLCARADVAQLYLDLHVAGQRRFQFDRTGSSLMSGGDNDLAACACRLGLGVGLFPELKLTHLIPPERLTEDYLMRLVEGIAFSSVLLDAEWNIRVEPRGLIGKMADLMRTLRLKGPDRAILRAAYAGRDRAARLMATYDEAEGAT